MAPFSTIESDELTEQQMSQYISNLIYIAYCLFIHSQYDVYWPLSNAALSGATSECPFHNRNIFIHQVLANCLHQYCSSKNWNMLILLYILTNCKFLYKITSLKITFILDVSAMIPLCLQNLIRINDWINRNGRFEDKHV